MPPAEVLGWFTQPGDCEAAAQWLLAQAAGRFAVSLDMLCYGGLVASREAGTPPDLALSRLQTLRELRARRPGCQIAAFNVILRLGTTVTSAQALPRHEDIRRYSQLVDRVQRLGDDAARAELEEVTARLGPDALSTYLDIRRRNHTVNRRAVELVAEGVLDYLALVQEDAAAVGLHIPEQVALRDQAQEQRVSGRVSLHAGADEAGMVLVARQCAVEWGYAPTIAVEYGSAPGADIIPRFENRPLREMVESQIRAAGARTGPPGQADAILFVHTPVGEQLDISEAPEPGQAPALALQAEALTEGVTAAAGAGRLVGLADTAYCNGADPELIAALVRSGAGPRLGAFAGWNTAANTVGTVVSHLCLQAAAAAAGGAPDGRASARFIASRLIDDYGYQSRVRQAAMQRALAAGADPFALGTAWPEMEAYVRQQLQPLAHGIYSDVLAAEDPPAEVRVSLPWRRLFEVDVEVGS